MKYVLEKCKTDLEFGTLENAVKDDSILSLLDETKSGIWNRVNLIRKVSKSEDLKISIASLATVKMHLEQFLVFEIHSYLSPGVGFPIDTRLRKHSDSLFKLDLDSVRHNPNMFGGDKNLLLNLETLLEIGECSLFAGHVAKFSLDIICGCIQLGFGRIGESKMFATRENGMKARQILLKYIDGHYQLKDLFSDLIQLQSVPNSPIWFKAATSKLLTRSFTRPNALLSLANGLFLTDKVNLPIESVLNLAKIVASQDPSKCNIEDLIGIENEHVNRFVSAILILIHQKSSKSFSTIMKISSDGEFSREGIIRICKYFTGFPQMESWIGFDQIKSFLFSSLPPMLEAYISTHSNTIEPKVPEMLNEYLTVHLQQNPKQFLETISKISKTRFDVNLEPSIETVDVSDKIESIIRIMSKSERRTKLRVFYWALENFYDSNKKFAGQLLGELLSRDPTKEIGLDFTDENIVSETIEILSFLLIKVTDEESLQLVLAIVALCISDLGEFSFETRKNIKTSILNPIQCLCASTESESIRQLATDLVQLITTGGAFKPDTIERKKSESVKKPDKPEKSSENHLTQQMSKMTISDWSDHLDDPLLPIRSGAIRELTKSLKQGELDTNLTEKLKTASYVSIQNSDPFLFLSGIEALATLALGDDEIMTDLIRIFKENKSPTLTLQIGEILARICSRMGDLAARYSSIIIPVLLSSASNSNIDELLIASSISAVADLLPLLGFYIHDIQHEIANAVEGFISPMNPKPVRLAACLLARLLIEKSKVSILSVLDETIAQMYKTLKRYRDDFLEDDDIREKSALAIESIDEKVKSYLTPKIGMNKKITILPE